jgi:hypothetical protein
MSRKVRTKTGTRDHPFTTQVGHRVLDLAIQRVEPAAEIFTRSQSIARLTIQLKLVGNVGHCIDHELNMFI